MKETERKTVFEYGPDELPGYKRFKPEIKEVEKKNPIPEKPIVPEFNDEKFLKPEKMNNPKINSLPQKISHKRNHIEENSNNHFTEEISKNFPETNSSYSDNKISNDHSSRKKTHHSKNHTETTTLKHHEITSEEKPHQKKSYSPGKSSQIVRKLSSRKNSHISFRISPRKILE